MNSFEVWLRIEIHMINDDKNSNSGVSELFLGIRIAQVGGF